ncbi:hypothetical protein TCAL_08550 [Tigriopus californicus]|uniref:Protein KRI1 homolog n=1 Tax=Tigriopus californicus TaxID=6832 RepID=A0A553PGF1_TIGCA|nr:protein KRI1 homolog [Tigriopus californicus]TRY76750.1 hypothetical protein TCAL_08550 [Tigriopus californicus]|eukprot:TCALIF_08550-PA protein Name:"Similar to KRI1 Protein KRI1 homolog (Bos taurus)" AED:0.00 eAED:0.01 QI:0/-1/0/1/-1/1/1/0/745
MTSLLGPDSSSSSDSDSDSGPLKVNAQYAQVYNTFREKEVYQKLKDKYGAESHADEHASLDGSGSSSSDESEDEEAQELTDQVEKDFYKTLASLKNKDPRIYDGQTRFFQDPAPGPKATQTVKAVKEKPVFWSDLQRQVILENEGKFKDDEDPEPQVQPGPSYVQEMEQLRQSLKTNVHHGSEDDDDEDNDDDDLLVPRKKTDQEQRKEDQDYKAWLQGQKDELPDEAIQQDLQGLKDFWSQKDLGEDEQFLKDYILNKRYLADEPDRNYQPTYEEVVHDSDENLSADEANVRNMEQFEHKYNYRFEEPDEEFIKRYPRTIKDSLRNAKNSRKVKREEIKERKEREKIKKREELKQLKAMKKKEIMGKLDKLKKVAGSGDLDFETLDLDGDFDPAEYDRKMAQVFAQYDHANDGQTDETKPEFSDLESDLEAELETENWDDWEGHNTEADPDDPDLIMDCDYEPHSKAQTQNEIIESTRNRKKIRKSKFAQVVEQSKPVFNPDDRKTFEEYLNEYYKLDYEDMIGDLPCRFKYRSVPQNDFGLSADEVLNAPDRELNSWVSLKKTCSYRPNEEEQHDIDTFKQRGNNVFLKRKYLPSLFETNPDQALELEKKKKSEKIKRRKRNRHGLGQTEEGDKDEDGVEELKRKEAEVKKRKVKEVPEATTKPTKRAKLEVDVKKTEDAEVGTDSKKKKRKRKRGSVKEMISKKKVDVNADIRMSDDRLKAYGLKPNQFKRKMKKQKYHDKT